MDIKELESWIQTDEGRGWLEGQKAALVAKNKELLESLHLANGKVAQAEQRSADASKLLDDERRAMNKAVLDGPLAAELKKAAVFDSLIETSIPEIQQGYALAVRADGNDRKVFGKITENGVEREADMSECVQHWLVTDRGKASRLETNSGSGAPGSTRPMAASDSDVAAFRAAMGLR